MRTERWRRERGPEFTFLKKGIRFSFARGDKTAFGLALGRRWAGSSLSSGSKPVASMSMATHTDKQDHRHVTQANTTRKAIGNRMCYKSRGAIQNLAYCIERAHLKPILMVTKWRGTQYNSYTKQRNHMDLSSKT